MQTLFHICLQTLCLYDKIPRTTDRFLHTVKTEHHLKCLRWCQSLNAAMMIKFEWQNGGLWVFILSRSKDGLKSSQVDFCFYNTEKLSFHAQIQAWHLINITQEGEHQMILNCDAKRGINSLLTYKRSNSIDSVGIMLLLGEKAAWRIYYNKASLLLPLSFFVLKPSEFH